MVNNTTGWEQTLAAKHKFLQVVSIFTKFWKLQNNKRCPECMDFMVMVRGETRKPSFQGSLYLSRESLGNRFFEGIPGFMHKPTHFH
jgi:predicted ABC-type exoprotein transport system permease subunit